MAIARPNFIKASNLIFLALLLSIVHWLLPDIYIMTGMTPVFITVKLLLLALGFLVRIGYSWTKYLMMVLLIWSLVALPDTLVTLPEKPLPNLVELAIVLVIGWATVLVFIVQRSVNQQDYL